MNPTSIEEMPFGHAGMLTGHEYVDLKTGEISKAAVLKSPDELTGPEDLRAHPLLIVRDEQGLFHIWGETPAVWPDRFEGESVWAQFHNLDHVPVDAFDLEVAS